MRDVRMLITRGGRYQLPTAGQERYCWSAAACCTAVHCLTDMDRIC